MLSDELAHYLVIFKPFWKCIPRKLVFSHYLRNVGENQAINSINVKAEISKSQGYPNCSLALWCFSTTEMPFCDTGLFNTPKKARHPKSFLSNLELCNSFIISSELPNVRGATYSQFSDVILCNSHFLGNIWVLTFH